MKLHTYHRITALGATLALAAVLGGCGANAKATSTAESATASPESTATTDTAVATGEDAYADIANFSISDSFDDNGYFKGITAMDYVILPADYTALSLPAGTDKLGDTDVMDYINTNILASYTTTNKVTDRAAVDGDTVNIDYVGKVDGVAFDGGDTKGSGADLTLGSGSYIDNFEEQIVGHTPGDSFDVTVTFPEDYGTAELAGKEAVFATTLNSINEEVTPELTDSWVAENLSETTGTKTVDELKSYVSDNLLFNQESTAVFNALSSGATYSDPLPQEMVDYSKNYFVHNLYQSAAQYGVDMATLLSAYGYEDLNAFLDAASDSITSSVQQLLLVQAVAESQGIVCDDGALATNFADFYGTAADPDKYIEAYGKNYVKMMVLNDLAMQNLLNTATIAAE
ncbi:MAG: FKBP-type peptidyl-prolyl cis-trans isomerase [Gemmiger sp.]|nr:FKBP-type peptidyl-prolyl cis-trans isomerase [Gemmiger sp.]